MRKCRNWYVTPARGYQKRMPDTMILPLVGLESVTRPPFFGFKVANQSSRVSGCDRPRRHVLDHNRTRANHGAFADRHTWQNARIKTDPNIALNANRTSRHRGGGKTGPAGRR